MLPKKGNNIESVKYRPLDLRLEQRRRMGRTIMKEEIRIKFVDKIKQILRIGLNSKNIVKAVILV